MLIAQITDTHIVGKNESWLREPSTQTKDRLERVVAYLNQLNPLPEVVLLTGDASDTGTKETYGHLNELLEPLKSPVYLIPGNHDCRQEMRSCFLKNKYMPRNGFIQYTIDDFPVRLIGLDTHIEGKDYGRLCNERLDWLTGVMKKEKEKPALIFMHHPPANTGTKLFDLMKCQLPMDFETFIQSQKNLIGILTGHYHHLCVTSYGGKMCWMAPSVAPIHYFASPIDDEVTALELEDAALTLHKWDAGHLMTSHVIRLKKNHKRIDWASIKNKIKSLN